MYYSNQKARRKLQLDWLSEIFFALLITSCETYKRKFKYTAAAAATVEAAANIKYKTHYIPKFSPNISYIYIFSIIDSNERRKKKKIRKKGRKIECSSLAKITVKGFFHWMQSSATEEAKLATNYLKFKIRKNNNKSTYFNHKP